MADQKKVIKVNDLTIEAENVHFEPVVREERPVHPLFGPRRPRMEQPQPQSQPQDTGKTPDEETTEADQEAGQDQEQEEQQPEQQERRPPFSWL